jgi:hypothetical protein
MSNPVILQRQKFEHLNVIETPDNIYYGYTLSDDYEACFCDNLTKEDMDKPPLEFLKQIFDEEVPSSDIERGILTHMCINRVGIHIDGEYFEHKEFEQFLVGTIYEIIETDDDVEEDEYDVDDFEPDDEDE